MIFITDACYLIMDRTEEPPIYEGLFLAKDEEVATFVDLVRGNMRSVRTFDLFIFLFFYNTCLYRCFVFLCILKCVIN